MTNYSDRLRIIVWWHIYSDRLSIIFWWHIYSDRLRIIFWCHIHIDRLRIIIWWHFYSDRLRIIMCWPSYSFQDSWWIYRYVFNCSCWCMPCLIINVITTQHYLQDDDYVTYKWERWKIIQKCPESLLSTVYYLTNCFLHCFSMFGERPYK